MTAVSERKPGEVEDRGGINLIFAGVGGQGIVLASRLVAQTALRTGQMVRTAETIGMAQRGGSVLSHMRIGAGVASPMLPLRSAGAIVGFEPAEAVRCLPYLATDGVVVVSRRAIPPVTSSLAATGYDGSAMLAYLRRRARRVIAVDGDAVCTAAGSPKVLNVALLGAAAAAGALGVTRDALEATIAATLPEKLVAMNLTALAVGARYALEEEQP